MKKILYLLGILLFFSVYTSCSDDKTEEDPICKEQLYTLGINQFQYITSHNSYHLRPHEYMMQFLNLVAVNLPAEYHPKILDYNHLPIPTQLNDYGIRGIELDVFRDPDGGLFYNRQGDRLIGFDPASGEEALLEPGLKVLHFPDFDYRTHHLTFKSALEGMLSWSNTHPDHLPVFIVVQAKEESPDDLIPGYDLTKTLSFDKEGVEEIESEIQEVFGSYPDQIITPDVVRKGYTSLREAIMNQSWPTLEESRGRLIFILLAEEGAINHYMDSHPSLEGRWMFVFGEEDHDETAFLKVDDPLMNEDYIKQRVRDGFIIKTRADADTYEARNGDYSRMRAAFSSGAQLIATDYYIADPRAATDPEWSDYRVHFPEFQLSIVNPVNTLSEMWECEIKE